MFTTLYALAKQAPLMITIAPEGGETLRVNVTPVPADGKSTAGLPAPLSLLATPEEFDAEFEAALSAWRAPKRSLVQQALDAAAPAAPAAADAPKVEAKPEKERGKGGRKPRGEKPADAGANDQQAGADETQAAADGQEQAEAAAPGQADEAGEGDAGGVGSADDSVPASSTEVDAPIGDGTIATGTAAARQQAGADLAGLDKLTLDLF